MSANQQPSVSNQDEDPLLSDEDDEENEDQLESSNSGSSELHIVGEILRRRYRKRRYELKIRWYEHGEESDTWEDELNLIESGGSEVLKMIADFKEEQKRREKQKREERKFWVTVDSENEDEHQHEDEEYFGEKLSEAKREKKKLYDPTRKASETEKLLSILSNQKRLTRKAMNQMLDEPSSRSAVEANGNSRDNEREEPAPASPANRGRGRPRVSKTAPAPIDNVSPKRGRGRPRGSNNKKFFSPTKMNRSLRSCRTAPESDNIAEEFLQAAGAEEADDGHDELQLEDIEGSNAHQGGQLTFVEDDAHEDNDVARHEEREAHEEVDLQINVDNGTATDDATAFRPFHEGDHRRRHRDAPEDDRDHHLGNMMFGRRRNNRNSGNSRRPYQGRPSSSWESNEGNNQSRREDGNNHCEFGPPEGDTGTVSNWLPVTVTLPMYGTSGPSHSRSGSRSASPEMEATQRRISTTKKTVRFPEQLKEVYEFERDDSDASDDMESDRDERHEDEGASDSDDGEESDSTDVEVLDPVNEDFLIDGTDFHGEDPHDSIDMLGPIGMADQGDLYDCERLVVYDWKDFKKQAVSKNMPQPTLERVISIVEQRFPHQMECAISNDRDEKMKEYLMYTLPNGNNFLHELCSSPCDLELKHVADDLITMICRAAQIRGRLLSQKNAQGYTPLHLAVYVGADCYVKSLLKQKAPLELLDGVGRTPLHVAFDRDDVTIMERLLRGGANFEHFGCLQRRIGNTSTPGFATLERFSNKFRSLLHTARHEVYNGFEEVEVVSPVFTIQPHKMEAHFIFEHEAYQLHSDYEYLLFFFVCNMEEDEWTARCCNVGPAAPLVFQEGSPAINGIQCYTGPDSSNWPMIFNPVFGDDVKHTISVVLKERKSLVVALQVVLVKIVDQ